MLADCLERGRPRHTQLPLQPTVRTWPVQVTFLSLSRISSRSRHAARLGDRRRSHVWDTLFAVETDEGPRVRPGLDNRREPPAEQGGRAPGVGPILGRGDRPRGPGDRQSRPRLGSRHSGHRGIHSAAGRRLLGPRRAGRSRRLRVVARTGEITELG